MANPPRRVYWDASCFICFLNRAELARREICEDVLRNAQARVIALHTSTWTIAETIKPKAKSLPGARTLTAREIAAIDGMFRWSWIKKIDVDQRIAFKAAELSRDFGLAPSDAVHAATAIIWRLDVLQ
jgi:predicted nucleic acid-binding protein